MAEPRLLAWADSRPHVGMGHVVRSFALAQAWADHGGHAVLCVPDEHELVRALTGDPRVTRRTLADDELVDAARDEGAAWVSIDSYATTARTQRAVRDTGARVLVIDDHAIAAPYDADLLLDQNLGAVRATAARLGSVDEVLLGVRHALLRRSFRVPPTTAETAPRDRVVITLGGNPSAEVRAFGREVAERLAARTPVELVLGRVEAGEVGAPGTPNVTEHDIVRDAAALYARAAVVVAAAGSTVWELCASGCAGVLLAVADNQVPLGEQLARAGAARFAGPIAATTPAHVVSCVGDLLDAPAQRDELARRARTLVDGLGANRVVALMRSHELHLRPASADDVARYFEWANDPAVRAASFTTASIAWDDHVRWFEDRLVRSSCRLFVADDVAGTAVGQIRFDLEADEALVGISLAADARGRGLAAPLIVAGVRSLVATVPGIATVRAEVRTTNEPSARAFVAAGFEHADRYHRDGVETDVFVRTTGERP